MIIPYLDSILSCDNNSDIKGFRIKFVYNLIILLHVLIVIMFAVTVKLHFDFSLLAIVFVSHNLGAEISFTLVFGQLFLAVL